VSKARLAHGFSVHGISGNIGWAAAPVFLGGVAAMSSWRTAVLVSAVIPLVMLLLLFFNRAALRADPPASRPAGQIQEGTFAFLRLPTVWMCFGFFFLSAIALGGIQSFASASLIALYDVTLASATTAYTAYMLASAGGMVAGGFIATRALNHDRTIMISFMLAAALALLLAMAVTPGWMVVPLMGAIGLASGVAGPSRDLLIRSAAPANATGRVFGVVYSGLDTGLSVGPLMFGALMDAHHPSWVFLCIGLFQALAIVTAVGVGSSRRAPGLQKA
jgi:MFS family permease